MTVWTPEKIQAAQIKRAATMAKKREAQEKREARKAEQEPKANGHDSDSQQSAAVKARWAGEKASEQDLQQFFAQIQLDEGLALLARMRTNTETAAKALNNRISADDAQAVCETCKTPKQVNRQWALVRPKRDLATGQVRNYYYCSLACVALENQKTQGVFAVSDRGMLKEHNPRPQPTDPTAR